MAKEPIETPSTRPLTNPVRNETAAAARASNIAAKEKADREATEQALDQRDIEDAVRRGDNVPRTEYQCVNRINQLEPGQFVPKGMFTDRELQRLLKSGAVRRGHPDNADAA